MHKKGVIRKSLKYSFLDGTFFSVMFGFGDSYFTPYAVALKATNVQIGLLSSLPGLVSALLQIFAPACTERAGRRRIMNWGVFIQAALWLPILLVPYLFPSTAAGWLIVAVTLYLLSSGMAGPAWGSIMSQYLPAKKRGVYFSWRQKIHGSIALAATFAAAAILFLFPRESMTGFSIIFSVALVCRFFSWYYLSRMHEPRLVCRPEAAFTLWDFLARVRTSNFAKFVFFVGAMSFAVNLSAPFFSVYMLRELKFDYLSYVVVNSAATVATLLSLSAWGRHSDRHGCITVIRLTSVFLPLIPVLWLVSTSRLYLTAVQLFSGFAWAGFNLAVSNFIYDAVSEAKRVRCIAYFNLINGIGVFCGAALGGWLIGHLPPLTGSRILTIFVISGLLRLGAGALLLPRLREVKPVEQSSNLELFFSVLGVKPLIGIVQNALRIE
jgi:MFS family permease